MARGLIQYWNNLKGFGFVRSQDERDAFLHVGELLNSGFREVRLGDCVDFNIIESARGLLAWNVKLINHGSGPKFTLNERGSR